MTRYLIILTLLILRSPGFGQDVRLIVAQGRSFLYSHDLPNAHAKFTLAVQSVPSDESANFLYAATRILFVPYALDGSRFLDRLGFPAKERDVYHWTAQVPKDRNGWLLAPTNLSVQEIIAFARTNVLVQVSGAVTNLDRITSSQFSITLSSNETAITTVTIDLGDVLLMRSLLRAMESSLLTLSPWNTDAQLSDIRALKIVDSLNPEIMLDIYSDLLKAQKSVDTVAAGVSFGKAVDDYLLASEFIRSRPTNVVRLFNYAPEMRSREQRFRTTLAELKSSLHQKQVLSYATNVTVSLAPFFSQGYSFRALLPQFRGSSLVADSFPDPTFGSVIFGLDAGSVSDALISYHWLLPDKLIPHIRPVKRIGGDVFEISVSLGEGTPFMIQTSTNLIQWQRFLTGYATNGVITFRDALPGAVRRFYRVQGNMVVVSGHVYDQTAAKPLANASVTVLPASVTTVSDSSGFFEFVLSKSQVPNGTSLRIVATGFQNQSVGGVAAVLRGSQDFNVFLKRLN